MQKTVVRLFRISNCNIIEEWSQNPKIIPLPREHYDKDEDWYEKTGELKFPLASCIIYIEVSELEGASLVLSECNTTIKPRSNMIVMLRPGVLHKITTYKSGKRISINWNLW